MKKSVNGVISDMTEEEEAEMEKVKKDAIAREEKIKDEDAKKASDKASGNKKLKDLGLTDDEITALTG